MNSLVNFFNQKRRIFFIVISFLIVVIGFLIFWKFNQNLSNIALKSPQTNVAAPVEDRNQNTPAAKINTTNNGVSQDKKPVKSGNVYTLAVDKSSIVAFDNDVDVITQEFYKQYPDNYDFLTIFPTFDIKNSFEMIAYSDAIKSDTRGICQPIVNYCKDKTCNFKRLLNINFFVYKSSYYQDYLKNTNDLTDIIVHETAHYWSTGIPALKIFKGLNKSCYDTSIPLKQDQTNHWSEGLQMPEMAMDFLDYSTYWIDKGNGYYEFPYLYNAPMKFHPFDLYLMGLMSKEEIKNNFPNGFPLLSNIKDYGKRDYEEKTLPDGQVIAGGGYAVKAKLQNVSIDDVVKVAGGERVPSSKDSQKDFTMAFVILTDKNDPAPETLVQTIEASAKIITDKWSYATNGLSTMNASK